ncbi:MAG: nitroreductase family protein [Prevotellaceae bacterium]|nr:nitroreductase family protein [Prevotellaceae bacterium]
MIEDLTTMIKKLLIGAFAALSMISCGSQEKQMVSVVDKQTTIDEVIMSRRSIRRWQDKPISRDTLDIVMKHGINAPNGKGIQAYEVRVIDKPELLKEMSDAIVKDMPNVGERTGFRNIFVDAPCVVFIAAYNDYDLSQVDCGLLGENIILSAWSMGIGSCCLGSSARMLNTSESAVPYLKRLDFSDDYKLLYCIALGYPDEIPDARPRNEEKVHFIE